MGPEDRRREDDRRDLLGRQEQDRRRLLRQRRHGGRHHHVPEQRRHQGHPGGRPGRRAPPGIQRIIAGTQTFTIYKSPKQLAPAAAQFAVNLLQGKDIGAQGETDGVPSTLLEPTVVNKDNIQDTVIKDGIYKVADVCVKDIAAKCTALGIK